MSYPIVDKQHRDARLVAIFLVLLSVGAGVGIALLAPDRAAPAAVQQAGVEAPSTAAPAAR